MNIVNKVWTKKIPNNIEVKIIILSETNYKKEIYQNGNLIQTIKGKYKFTVNSLNVLELENYESYEVKINNDESTSLISHLRD